MNLKAIQHDLQSPQPRVVIRALQSAGRVSSKEQQQALDLLEPFLAHGEAFYRYSALLSLIELGGGDRHLDQVLEMLNDSDPKIREAAVIALAQGTQDGIDSRLEGLLSSLHAEIRYQAPITLVERGALASAPKLHERLQEEGDVEVQVNLIAALGDMRYTQGRPLLLKFAQEAPYEILRFEASCALGRMQERAAAPLLAAFADHFEYGLEACTVLDTLQDASVVPVLLKKYSRLFLPAQRKLPLAATLARLGNNVGKAYLIAKSTAFGLETKILALDRLGRTRQPWAKAPLQKALTHHDELVRDGALEALKELGCDDLPGLIKELLAEHRGDKRRSSYLKRALRAAQEV